MQPYPFVQAEQEVHVVYGLSRGTFQQVVDDRHDEQFALVLFEIQEAFVGVDHLFQVGHPVGEEGEVVILVVVVVQLFEQLELDGQSR